MCECLCMCVFTPEGYVAGIEAGGGGWGSDLVSLRRQCTFFSPIIFSNVADRTNAIDPESRGNRRSKYLICW